MISQMKTTLEQLETRLEDNDDLSPEDRTELLKLVEELRSESSAWSQTAAAEEIKATLEEAAAPGDSSPSFHDRLLQLEASSPNAATLIGRLANMLSRMGI